MMNLSSFHTFWKTLVDSPLTALSDSELVAAVHCGVAACQLAGPQAAGAAYGDARACLRQLRRMTEELQRRYAAAATLLQRATLLRTLHFAHYESAVQTGREEEAQYWETVAGLVDAALAPSAERLGAEERYAVGCLVFLQWYGWMPEAGETPPPALAQVRRWLSQWAAGQQADGSWSGISDREALQRMALWSMNRCLLLDDTYAAALDKAFACYYAVADALPEESPQRWQAAALDLCLLRYQVLQQGPLSGPDGQERLQRLSRALEGQLALGGHSPAHTAWLYSVQLEAAVLQLHAL